MYIFLWKTFVEDDSSWSVIIIIILQELEPIASSIKAN